MSSLTQVRLREICAEKPQYGYTAKASSQPVGPKLLRTTDIVSRHLNWNDVPTCEIAPDDHEKYRLNVGDIVISRMGTVGISARVAVPVDAVFASYLVRLRIDARCADSRFVYYVLNSPAWWEYVQAVKTGAVQPNLNAQLMGDFTFRLPSLALQRAIVRVLGPLDDLIQTDRSLAADCDTLAVTLVWHHDPAERVPLHALTSQGIETADPSGLIDHFSLPAFDVSAMPERVDGSTVRSRKLVLREPATLVSRLNPHIPRVWMAYPTDDAIALASTEFVPFTGDGCPTEFVWAACAGAPFLDQMRSRVTGTTGSHQRVDKAVIPTLTVPDPRTMPAGMLDTITSLVRQAHAARVEADDLRRVRDELLPLLMSGRVVPGEVAS